MGVRFSRAAASQNRNVVFIITVLGSRGSKTRSAEISRASSKAALLLAYALAKYANSFSRYQTVSPSSRPWNLVSVLTRGWSAGPLNRSECATLPLGRRAHQSDFYAGFRRGAGLFS